MGTFKKLYEAVTPTAKAYWISPVGESIPVMLTHIDTVLKNLEKFGLTTEYVNKVAEEQGGMHELRDGGKARDVIMTDLLKNGWVRIRKVTKPYEFWTIQIETGMSSHIDRTTKKSIIKWVEEMYRMNEHRLKDTVVVLNTKGDKLFGGSSNFREQKTLKDIYLDDTGVFESVFATDQSLLNEYSMSRFIDTTNNYDVAILTAQRSFLRNKQTCKIEQEVVSKSDNLKRNKQLSAQIKDKGYSYVPVKGEWIEDNNKVVESSFLVINHNNNKTFKQDMIELGVLWDQDAISYIEKGSNTLEIVYTSNCVCLDKDDETGECVKRSKIGDSFSLPTRSIGKYNQFDTTHIKKKMISFDESINFDNQIMPPKGFASVRWNHHLATTDYKLID